MFHYLDEVNTLKMKAKPVFTKNKDYDVKRDMSSFQGLRGKKESMKFVVVSFVSKLLPIVKY